jgi:hypothetical protein
MGKQIELSELVLWESLSSRGGGIEIDLSRFGFKGEKMAAYQNHLGGGMLSRICSNDTIRIHTFYELTDKQEKKLDKIAERLKKYFFSIQYGEYDESHFESIQKRAVRGY